MSDANSLMIWRGLKTSNKHNKKGRYRLGILPFFFKDLCGDLTHYLI